MKNLVFTDLDGFKIFRTDDDELVDSRGRLLSIEEEANIRVEIGDWKSTGLEYE